MTKKIEEEILVGDQEYPTENTVLIKDKNELGPLDCLSLSSIEDPSYFVSDESGEVETEVDIEVKLEADAESLISSSSDDSSTQSRISEFEIFRFTRSGLSVYLSLEDHYRNIISEPKEQARIDSTNEDDHFTEKILVDNSEANTSVLTNQEKYPNVPLDSMKNDISIFVNSNTFSRCIIINFKELCQLQYMNGYSIGKYLKSSARYDNTSYKASNNEKQMSQLGIQFDENHKDLNSAKTDQHLRDRELTQSIGSDVDLVNLRMNDENKFLKPLHQDRLSLVIQDIIHRINRNGILADPRDICRKGGGNNGKFYDLDDEFVDDSVVYEWNKQKNNNHSSSDFEKKKGEIKNKDCSRIDMSVDSSDTYSDYDNDNEVFYYDANHFVFDDNPDNDSISLLVDNDLIEDIDHSNKESENNQLLNEDYFSMNPNSNIPVAKLSDTNNCDSPLTPKKFVTRKYWLKQRAWRESQSKVTSEVHDIMVKIEEKLDSKGSSEGLYVEPSEIITICKDGLKGLFTSHYPKIPWDITYLLVENIGENFDIEPSDVICEKDNVKQNDISNIDKKIEPDCDQDLFLGNSNSPVFNEVVTLDNFLSLPLDDNDVTNPDGPENGIITTHDHYSKSHIFDNDKVTQHSVQHQASKKKQKYAANRRNNNTSFTPDDIVLLSVSASFQNLITCISLVTNMLTKDIMNRWILIRLGVYNQLVYNALEDKIFNYIILKSPLFRRKGSFFLRNLKKAVDSYLHWLSKMKESSLSKTNINIQSTFPSEDQCNNKLNRLSTPLPSQDLDFLNVPESPFSPIAAELLNWAIVYNCRRHELRELGEVLDEWTASFSTYVVDILNKCIGKKYQTNNTLDPSIGLQNVNSSSVTSYLKKSRVWLPVKFMEESLNKFKTHFNVTNLYERRSKKFTVPAFIKPCKGFESLKLKSRSAKIPKEVNQKYQSNIEDTHSDEATVLFTPIKINQYETSVNSKHAGSLVGTSATTLKAQKRKRKDINDSNIETDCFPFSANSFNKSKEKISPVIKKKNKFILEVTNSTSKLFPANQDSILGSEKKKDEFASFSSISYSSPLNTDNFSSKYIDNLPIKKQQTLISKVNPADCLDCEDKSSRVLDINHPATSSYDYPIKASSLTKKILLTSKFNKLDDILTQNENQIISNNFNSPLLPQDHQSNFLNFSYNSLTQQQNENNGLLLPLSNNSNAHSRYFSTSSPMKLSDFKLGPGISSPIPLPLVFPPFQAKTPYWEPLSYTSSDQHSPISNQPYFQTLLKSTHSKSNSQHNFYNYPIFNPLWMSYNNSNDSRPICSQVRYPLPIKHQESHDLTNNYPFT